MEQQEKTYAKDDKNTSTKRAEMFSLLRDSWIQLGQAHQMTKEIFILSEELSIGLSEFIQPIKEHRDAYEHIMRVQTKLYSLDSFTNDDKTYIFTNVQKALGHEYRAFFDSADFICITVRNEISKYLKPFELFQIIEFWPNYPEAKKKIVSASENIAKIRTKKDVGDESMMGAQIEEYYAIAKELRDIYKFFYDSVLGPLISKYRV